MRSRRSRLGQDRDHHTHAGAEGGNEEGARRRAKENESRVGKDTIAEVYKETGFKP